LWLREGSFTTEDTEKKNDKGQSAKGTVVILG
jgi:hypothetical protein